MKIILTSIVVLMLLIVMSILGFDAFFDGDEIDFYLNEIDKRINANLFSKNKTEIEQFEIRNGHIAHPDTYKSELVFVPKSSAPYYRISYLFENNKCSGVKFRLGLMKFFYKELLYKKVNSYLKTTISNTNTRNGYFINHRIIVYLGVHKYRDAFLEYLVRVKFISRQSSYGKTYLKDL